MSPIQAPNFFQLRLELLLTIVLKLNEYLLGHFTLVPCNLVFNVVKWLAERAVYVIKGTVLSGWKTVILRLNTLRFGKSSFQSLMFE